MQQKIESKIFEVRGVLVIIDFDLAELYDVETRVLKQAVKRNIDRFPDDFMFELTRAEYNFLRSQNVILENGRGKHSKFNPFAFTEQGVAMLSSVLRSKKAINVNIGIMRAFVLFKRFSLTNKDLSKKILELECKYDRKFDSVFEAIDYLLQIDKQENQQKEIRKIGFK